MSIISSPQLDNSSTLAKRFARLAAKYLDDPAAAKSKMAEVPLENLFRMLEMYRYNAFSDESRRGVLALEGFSQGLTPLMKSYDWHSAIADALEHARAAAFEENISKEDVVNQLQEGLRILASTGELPTDCARKVKTFFSTFESSLD